MSWMISHMTSVAEKRARLRAGLSGDKPLIAVGAHDAMSAQMIESAGFDAVWVSSFGVSTMTYALPDLNLISLSEALEAAQRIDRATNLPIIADCDNGYGGLNNVVRTVKEYERAGIAGVCVEDNLFPKRNSLYQGQSRRELLPPEEQARRIRAARSVQDSADFVFIARVEALIAGHGVAAACERADAYVDAGADAILIHSRDKTLSEIEGFLAAWSGVGRVPLVAVPTLFPDFTVDQLGTRGFRLVIFANQLMRASVKAMGDTLAMLGQARKAAVVDPLITPVNDIFNLVRTRETIALEDALPGPRA